MPDKPSSFTRFTDRDVVDLITEYPLAWLCPQDAGAAPPSLLPMLVECDQAGRPVTLLGHMARHNPLLPALSGDPRAMVLFTGPQGYVSPSMVSDPTWAPTWNYARLDLRGRIRFQPDQGAAALLQLTEAMDTGEHTGWRPHMVGARYAAMERAIIAFRVDIDALSGRFKLGQDEPSARLAEILAHHGDPALVRWMRRFNPRAGAHG
jgi:transcriptional regulator